MADKEKQEEKYNGLGLPQTKGSFQLKGIVTGVQGNRFFQDTLTKESQKPWRILNFGTKINEDKTMYVSLSGGERENVAFCKTEDGKTDTIKVAWKDRHTFKKEGYRLVGVNVGLEKTKGKDGKEINAIQNLSEYDAIKYIAEHLCDDSSVFVKGDIDYSHSEDDKGNTKRYVQFRPKQVSLCQAVDFKDEKFKEVSDFEQAIIFMAVNPDAENPDKFIVSAKIVKYETIEDAEFIILNKSLATIFKKNLKPYTFIKVWGNINAEKDTTEVESKEVWGESNNMDRVNTPTIRELIITGASQESIDTKTYTEEEIEKAMEKVRNNKKADKEFGKSAVWGSVSNVDTMDDDDDTPWGTQ